MTIETASPSSAETLAALFDQLVQAVASKVAEEFKKTLDTRINARIEDWADNYLDDRLYTWATVHLDVEGDIERAVRDMDIDDMVREAVKDLTFEVTVS
jgi:uncharacterized protein YbcC (UPF0753/DUF2309 family)